MAGAITSSTRHELHAAVLRVGYAFVQGPAMRDLLEPHGTLDDWNAFANSWHHLEVDRYMGDGGRYRRRRYGAFTASGATIVRAPHQPHFQGTAYNPLNGGIERWFEPIDEHVGAGSTLRTVLAFSRSLFDAVAPGTPGWDVEVHQFRIEARAGEEGLPTPEGLHRDGVDYVLVLLVNRSNIASGVTTIYDLEGRPLGYFTLTGPFDAAIVDDQRVAHGVTPVEPIDPSMPAYRDVLVVTFRKKNLVIG